MTCANQDYKCMIIRSLLQYIILQLSHNIWKLCTPHIRDLRTWMATSIYVDSVCREKEDIRLLFFTIHRLPKCFSSLSQFIVPWCHPSITHISRFAVILAIYAYYTFLTIHTVRWLKRHNIRCCIIFFIGIDGGWMQNAKWTNEQLEKNELAMNRWK